VHQVKVQPFFRHESQTFVTAANASKDVTRYGLGVDYYIQKQNLKWTAQYLRALPQNTTSLKASHEFTMQLQLMYW
jgi:hypothetical protein